jgi:hypothetical protein
MGQLNEVRKANRDQNSSPGASITLRKPQGDHLTGVTRAHSRTGSFAGKSRGVGRHLGRDENSTPGHTVVRTPTLRDINGKFAGEGQGVKVFHPIGGGKRGNVHTKGLFHTTKKPGMGVGVKKSSPVRKGMLGPVDLGSMQFHTGARVGRRLVEVEKAMIPVGAALRPNVGAKWRASTVRDTRQLLQAGKGARSGTDASYEAGKARSAFQSGRKQGGGFDRDLGAAYNQGARVTGIRTGRTTGVQKAAIPGLGRLAGKIGRGSKLSAVKVPGAPTVLKPAAGHWSAPTTGLNPWQTGHGAPAWGMDATQHLQQRGLR